MKLNSKKGAFLTQCGPEKSARFHSSTENILILNDEVDGIMRDEGRRAPDRNTSEWALANWPWFLLDLFDGKLKSFPFVSSGLTVLRGDDFFPRLEKIYYAAITPLLNFLFRIKLLNFPSVNIIQWESEEERETAPDRANWNCRWVAKVKFVLLPTSIPRLSDPELNSDEICFEAVARDLYSSRETLRQTWTTKLSQEST